MCIITEIKKSLLLLIPICVTKNGYIQNTIICFENLTVNKHVYKLIQSPIALL